MADTYGIAIYNDSTFTQTFFVFAEPPTATRIDPQNIYVNSWWQSESVPPGGSTSPFGISKFPQAICAIIAGSPTIDTNVTTSHSQPITLGTPTTHASRVTLEISDVASRKKMVQFTSVTRQPNLNDPPNGFVLQTMPFEFDPNEVTLVGLGAKVNARGLVEPLAVTPASSGRTTIFFPSSTYYVSVGTYPAGQIINFHQESQTAAKCEFSSGRTHKTVRYRVDGTWTVEDYTK